MTPSVEIQKLLKTIDANIYGNPWFGDSLTKKLQGITATMAATKPKKLNHNIAEILTHMMAWRQFVIEHLNGNSQYEVWETELDWTTLPHLTDSHWLDLQQSFNTQHQLFLSQIEQKASQILEQKLGNRTYSFRTLLNGIIQHDIYHIGQISILVNLVKQTKY